MVSFSHLNPETRTELCGIASPSSYVKSACSGRVHPRHGRGPFVGSSILPQAGPEVKHSPQL